jgi:hypothetical protein
MGTFYIGCKVENHKDRTKADVVRNVTVAAGLVAAASSIFPLVSAAGFDS